MSKKKKILLTGGSGMVGRNFLENSQAKSWELIAPTSKEEDLTKYEEVFSYVQELMPDFIVHAAGRVGGIHANISNPVSFLVDNVDIGRNVIMAASQSGVRYLLNLGSSCMYPRNAVNPLSENQILQGELEPTNEGYALAKIFAMRLSEYVNKQNSEYRYKTIIPCNIYGRYDKFDPERSHLIPAILHKVHQAKINNEPRVEVWGDGKARREFMYADELASSIYYVLDNFEEAPSSLNIGVGMDYSINEYYQVAADIVGYDGVFEHDLDKPVGMYQKLVSIERQQHLGWAPKISLKEGMQRTYEYYLQEIAL